MSDIERSVLEVQQEIHERIARHDPLEQTLDAIVDWVGIMMPRTLVAIMRFHPNTNSLRLLPNNRFSDDYFWAMQNVPVSEDAGTCGRAAFTNKLVITKSIQKDPSWSRYHNIAKAEEVHACWSTPILTSKRELMGTFAIYHHAPVTPTAETQRYLTLGAALVALAMLRHRDTQAVTQRWNALRATRQVTCTACTLISVLNPITRRKPKQRSTEPETVRLLPMKPGASTHPANSTL
jgi:GAF domain-containing protein